MKIFFKFTKFLCYFDTIIRVFAGVRVKCGVLIAPQGREHEWMFASAEGQLQTAQNAGFGRLIIASMNRDQSFTDLSTVQDELNASISQLCPRLATTHMFFLVIDFLDYFTHTLVA